MTSLVDDIAIYDIVAVSSDVEVIMIEPQTALALAIEANPNATALLIGSGVSRSAQIPTGWEVQLDLIRRVANILKEDCEPDPAKWYFGKYGSDPSYTHLLEEIVPSQSERQGLLQTYFEGTEDDREAGRKGPQPAHRAIATLVKGGFIKLIITTNFDRLIEKALEAEGIIPSVISNADDLKAAKPYSQSQCTLVKVHGDYLDVSIRNTKAELSSYPRDLTAYLKRILNEHNLIVCGWSGTWDSALRSLLIKNRATRYSTYWAHTSANSSEAVEIINRRNAKVIKIDNADAFFSRLNNDVQSANLLNRPAPISLEIAKATLKRLIPDDKKTIEMYDLVTNEAEKSFRSIVKLHSLLDAGQGGTRSILEIVELYEANLEILIGLFSVGSRWIRKDQTEAWVRATNRLTINLDLTSRLTYLENLRRYPILVLTYVVGISAIDSLNFQLLHSILTKSRIELRTGEKVHILAKVSPSDVINRDVGQALFPDRQGKNLYTPTNEYLRKMLEPFFSDVLFDEKTFEEAFDQWEYLICLLKTDLDMPLSIPPGARAVVPIGSFGWRLRNKMAYQLGDLPKTYFNAVYQDNADEMIKALLDAGFFNSARSRFIAIRDLVEADLKELQKRYW